MYYILLQFLYYVYVFAQIHWYKSCIYEQVTYAKILAKIKTIKIWDKAKLWISG